MTGYILLDTPNHAQPQGTYPRRGGVKLSGTIIVHTSEGNWRSGVNGLTNLVRTRADWGCYHQGCDWEYIARYYPWEWETWQDTETNNWAVGIAAACKTSDWGNMPADVEEGYYRNLARMAADFVVYMRDVHGITVPLRRISGAQARARVPGFAAHGDSGVARSDPGANFDWPRLFNYAAQALAGGIQLQSGTTITPILEDELNKDQDAALGVVFHKVNQAPAAGHLASQGDINIVLARMSALEDAVLEALGKPRPAPTATLVKGDREPTVYAWDGGDGYRALDYAEFALLMSTGADLLTKEQADIDKALGAQK